MYDEIICKIPVENISAEPHLLKRLQTDGTYQTTDMSCEFERYIITKSGTIKHAEYQPVLVRNDKLEAHSEVSKFSGDLILQQLLFNTDEDHIIKLKAVVRDGKLIKHFMNKKLQLLECRRISNTDRIDFYKEISIRADQDILRKSKMTHKIKTFFDRMNFTK